jgi:hypothetical protein
VSVDGIDSWREDRLMRALVAFSAAIVGVGLLLAWGVDGASAQATPAVTTDAAQYLAGTTVTYTGTGWTGCTSIELDVFGPGGSTAATGITPTAGGSFTGTFTAGTTLTTYTITARSNPTQANCTANANFEVVQQLATTTTTSSTTTSTTSTTTTAVPHPTTTIGGSGSSPVAVSDESTSQPSDPSASGTELATTGNNTDGMLKLAIGLLCAGVGVLGLRPERPERST